MSAERVVVGGFSKTLPATTEIQEIAEQVKTELEEKTNKKYPDYKAICYRSQVVAGMNYLIKVSISNTSDECVHLKVFQALPCNGGEISLTSYQTGKTKEDPLDLF